MKALSSPFTTRTQTMKSENTVTAANRRELEQARAPNKDSVEPLSNRVKIAFPLELAGDEVCQCQCEVGPSQCEAKV